MDKRLMKGDLILVTTKGSIDKRGKNTLAIVVGNIKTAGGWIDEYIVVEFNHQGQKANKWSKSFFIGGYTYGESLQKRRALQNRLEECGNLSFNETTPYRGVFFPSAEWCSLLERCNTKI